jgi:hypothetical protein
MREKAIALREMRSRLGKRKFPMIRADSVVEEFLYCPPKPHLHKEILGGHPKPAIEGQLKTGHRE